MKHPLADNRPMTTKELAQYLSLNPRTIHEWKALGKIPFLKFGTRIRYDLEAVKEALAAK